MRLSMGRVTAWRILLGLQAVLLCAATRPPSLTPGLDDEDRVIVKLGKSVRLECPVVSDLDFFTEWKKDGQALNPGTDRYAFKGHDNKILRVRHVQMNDAGTYSCRAANGYGHVQYSYNLVIKDEENQVFQEGNRQFRLSEDVDILREGSKPVFENLAKMQEDQKLVKPKGSTITLICKVDGNPRPTVHWLRDGKALDDQPQQRNQMVKLRDGHAVLRLTWLSDEDDGAYTCVASNRLGSVNFTYTLDVVGEISAKPRLIAPHPINQSVYVGDSVSFHCYVQGDESDEKPDVEWLKLVKKGEEVPNPMPYRDQMFQVLQNAGQWLREQLPDGSYLNKLVIRNVKRSDQGMFVCLATNRMGFESRKAFLSVNPGHAKISNRNQNSYNIPHSTFLDNSKEQPDRGPTSSAHDDEDFSNNLPLQIALPACAVLVIILLTVFLMQRNNRCRKSPLTPPVSHNQRPPVPPHEREAYYFTNCNQHHLQQQQQSINPLLMSSREKMASPPKMIMITPTPSGELTGGSSDFSSVSRTHPSTNTTPHYYHHNHYGY